MVKQIMPTEDTHRDPCEENLHLLHGMIAAEYTVLTEARSQQGELDRIKSREINLLEVSRVVCPESCVCIAHWQPQFESIRILVHNMFHSTYQLFPCLYESPIGLYINACSFRFDKGQDNEVLCKATCE